MKTKKWLTNNPCPISCPKLKARIYMYIYILQRIQNKSRGHMAMRNHVPGVTGQTHAHGGTETDMLTGGITWVNWQFCILYLLGSEMWGIMGLGEEEGGLEGGGDWIILSIPHSLCLFLPYFFVLLFEARLSLSLRLYSPHQIGNKKQYLGFILYTKLTTQHLLSTMLKNENKQLKYL